MPRFRVTIPVTFTVRADDATEAEHAAMDAVEDIPLVDCIDSVSCVDSVAYSVGPRIGPWAEETTRRRMPEPTKQQMDALEDAQDTQTAYWEALTRLEMELGINLDDYGGDLSDQTVESLIGEFKEQEGEDDED